jgi:hypothetical protein
VRERERERDVKEGGSHYQGNKCGIQPKKEKENTLNVGLLGTGM